MAEFIRIKRYYNYHHPLCKKYLRFDFGRRCAYCGANESEYISGHRSFEIDHFKPQNLSRKDPEKDKYENLYYCCEICNGVTGKSGKWSPDLLDPCKEEIYGSGKHIIHSDETNDFKLIGLTPQGVFFIETINLNQRDQRIIRKRRFEYFTKVEERKFESERLCRNIEKINEKLKVECDPLLFELRDMLSAQLKNIEEENTGPYNYNETFEEDLFDYKYEIEFEATINKHISLNKIYGEFDLDYETILANGHTLKCYTRYFEGIKFLNGNRRIRISFEQANDWVDLIASSSLSICVFLFDLLDKKIYYASFNDFLRLNSLSRDSIYISIPVRERHELCEGNLEVFFKSMENYSLQHYGT